MLVKDQSPLRTYTLSHLLCDTREQMPVVRPLPWTCAATLGARKTEENEGCDQRANALQPIDFAFQHRGELDVSKNLPGDAESSISHGLHG